MNFKKTITAAGVIWLGGCLVMANAEEFNADNYLAGDLGGYRTKLHNSGIDLKASYVFELGTNLSGGESAHEYSYADQTEFGIDFDLDKLFGWQGSSFHFDVANRGGQKQKLSEKAGLDQLMQSMEISGRGRITRLSAFYYQQKLLDNKLDIKLGRLNVGHQFGNFRCETAYLGFCGSQTGNYNSTIYNYNIAPWGFVASYLLTPELYVRAGIYQQNPSWLKHSQRWNLGNPSGTQGVTLPVELGWVPHLNGLPGTYKLGFWHDNVGGADLYYNQDGQPLVTDGGEAYRHHSRNGGYFVADQQLTSVDGSEQGLSAFAMGTVSDSDMTRVDRSLAVGARYTGLFAGRPNDHIGVGVTYLHVSDAIADGERLQNSVNTTTYTPIQNDELVFATFYTVQVTPYMTLHPELQYLHNQGGISSTDDSWVAVMKGSIQF